jgi:Outer membrane lipoprotein carrier protein LolA-like
MAMRAFDRRAVALALFLLVGAGRPAAAADLGWGLPQLMQSLRQVTSSTAFFSERRELRMLSEPLMSSGTLSYVAPDKLQKRTLLPKPERLSIDGGKLTIERSETNENRTVALADFPEIGAFVESVRATLAGDLPALERYYAIGLQGDAGDWQITLEPKEKRLRELVKLIRIAGRGTSIRTIVSEQGDGDRSEMNIVESAK